MPPELDEDRLKFIKWCETYFDDIESSEKYSLEEKIKFFKHAALNGITHGELAEHIADTYTNDTRITKRAKAKVHELKGKEIVLIYLQNVW